ncbi:uncharacterized protein LOC135818079 [Sycon ciliatum]|uniref:uncharacterized protein LOC135818079 n=1 Tax=Sycon ciliatum TaxID=27933 RepID=UPI0031F62F04
MCGPGRTGKSSFLRSLLRQAFMSNVDSTIGVELEKVICTIEKQGLKYVWKQAEDSYQQQLALTHRAVGQEQRKKEIVAALRQQGVEIPKNTRSTSSMPSTPVASSSAVIATEQADTVSVCESAVSQQDEATHTGYSGQSATSSSETMDSQNVSTASKPEEVSTMSVQQVATAEQDVQQLQMEINSATQKFEGFIEDLKKGKSEVFTAEHLKNLTFIDVWDFAGQKLFAAIQHMVLACDRCAYAVVFDSSKKLQDRAKPTFGVDGEELPLSNSLEQTNFDVMETWFNAIHEVIGDSDNVPVFAIGTHVDKLPKKPEARKKAIEETEQYIWANAEGKAYANNIDKVVFVDNTRAGKDPEDPAVVQLRQDIIQQLQHQFSVKIPLRWLPLTISIGHIAKSFERPWLSVDELRRLAIAVGSISSDDPESDFQKMVKFHHGLGHLLHFIHNARLRDRVIIDIHWVLKTMSLLFCPEPKSMQSKRLRPQYDLLTQNGILLESLAIHRWSQHNRMTSRYTATEEQRDFLFEMGEHFALFYNTKTTVNVPGQRKEVTTRKFFVPALVERVARVQDEVSKGKPSPAMYLYSGADRYFPQTLFWCGVVRCMQRYSPKVDPILYHTSARILVKDRFWLVMQYFQHGIRLSLEIPVAAGTTKSSSTDAGTRADKSVCSPGVGTAASEDESAAVRICHELLPYLESELDKLKAFSLTHVKFSRAVRCPCSFSRDACRKHKQKSCVEIGCQHFAPLVEGLRPRCPSGARPEVDISDVRQYWPCFSEDAQTLERSDGKLDQSDLDLELVTGDAAAEAKGLAKVQQVTSGTVAPNTRGMRKVIDEATLSSTMTRVRRIRIGLIGQFGSGKTSLADSLRGEEFRPDKSSTPFLEVHQHGLRLRDGKLQEWGFSTAHLEVSRLIRDAETPTTDRKRWQDENRRKSEERKSEQEAKGKVSHEGRPPHTSGKQHQPEHTQLATSKQEFEEVKENEGEEPKSATPRSNGQEKPKDEILDDGSNDTAQKSVAPAKSTTVNKPDDPELVSAGELTQGVINEIIANSELMRNVGDEEVIMSMWDCGGQSIFSSLQHFMLSESFVIYLLCFDSVESLHLIKPQAFRPGEAAAPEVIDVAKELENIDHIRHWLTAVHFASTADSAAVQQDHVSYPPIIMVGNFADKLDPDLSLQQHKDKIWSNLCKLCCRSPVFAAMQPTSDGISTCDAKSLFLVNNREPSASPEVRQIHTKIQEATSIVLKGKEMPKSWVRFEWILQYLNQVYKEKGYTSHEWMKTMVAEACKIQDERELEELLLFYHSMRVIIYKPTKNPPQPDDLIFYNVQWLIKQINRFMFGKKYLKHEFGKKAGSFYASFMEEEEAIDLHNNLWQKGTASMRLVNITLASIPPDIRTKVIGVMVDWDLLYELGSNSKRYLVPSALHKQNPQKIEAALDSFSMEEAKIDSIHFSTADTPLLIAVEPLKALHEDSMLPAPATPMPHSSYFKLLVRLFKKWDIRSINTSHCELTYNTARLRLPNEYLDLDEFKVGHVEIFVAHYESSGALLVSLNFQHPLCTFQPGHISTADKRLRSISSICQQVCKDIVAELKELPFVTTFSVPLANDNVCGCQRDEWSDHTTRCRDLGYAPWRVRFAEQSTDVAASSHVMEAAYPDGNPCIKCKQDIQVPNNSHCWFNDTEFKLEGRSNKDAVVAISEQQKVLSPRGAVLSAEIDYSDDVQDLVVSPSIIACNAAFAVQSGSLVSSNQTEVRSPRSEALSCDSPNDSDLAAAVDKLEEISLASADVQVEYVAPDEIPEYRYVSETDTEQIPIRREGTVLFMEGGKVEFLAGTVNETLHISPPVHMMFQGTLPSEHGDGVTLHSVMAFGSHEAKFRRPVQVEIDVPHIAETDQIYLVHFPGKTSESAEDSGSGESTQLPTSRKCCTVVHVGNSTWTVTKLPDGEPYEIPAKQVDRNATLDRPEEDECPYSGITVDYQQKKICYSKKHFCHDEIWTSISAMSEAERKRLADMDDQAVCWLWVYAEKDVETDYNYAYLSVMVRPRCWKFREPLKVPPFDCEPLRDMHVVAHALDKRLISRTRDHLSYTFWIRSGPGWAEQRKEIDKQQCNSEAFVTFHSESAASCRARVGPRVDVKCRLHRKSVPVAQKALGTNGHSHAATSGEARKKEEFACQDQTITIGFLYKSKAVSMPDQGAPRLPISEASAATRLSNGCATSTSPDMLDPFESDKFVTTLQPWIKKLDATGLAKAIQALGMLTMDQVTRLNDIKKKDGGQAHNAELLEMILGEELDGFVKLFKAIKAVTNNTGKVELMKSLIPDGHMECQQ